MPFAYKTGEEVKKGDVVTYHGERGEVQFVVTGRSGNPAQDWHIDQFPGGGFMIYAATFGNVFVTESDEDLEFVSRRTAGSHD